MDPPRPDLAQPDPIQPPGAWRIYVALGLVALLVVGLATVIQSTRGSAADSAIGAANALEGIGYSCVIIRDSELSPQYLHGFGCTRNRKDQVSVFDMRSNREKDVIRRQVARFDGICDDVDRDDGAYLFGVDEPVWIFVVARHTITAGADFHGTSEESVKEVEDTLDVRLRRC
jgi:hypothetical protein